MAIMSTGSADASLSALLLGDAAKDDPIAAAKTKRDQRFAELLAAAEDAKATLTDVTKDGARGYWKWKMKELREQITAQVMGELNVTAEKLAALPLEDRLALEQKIRDMVEERLKLAIAEEMKKKQKTTLGFNPLAPETLATLQNLASSG